MTRTKGLVLAAALCAAGSAWAAPVAVTGTPTLDIYWSWADGTHVVYVDSIDLTLDGTDFSGESATYVWGADQITLNYTSGNVDPILNFGVSVLDSGAASIFTFIYSAPLAPTLNGPVNYDLRLSGSFADGGTNGGSVGLGTNSLAFLMEGTLNGTAFAGVGPTSSFGTPSAVYGPYINIGSTTCASCTTFGANLSFLGSGGGDVHTFSGRFELTAVPVPGAVWLLGSAVGLLGWMRRRST